ncbi:hypothetical protein OS493_012530 [Desmophyllum pertusum]|uniref:Ig-like domain-containing protein n=1 Tax=Desmophyllum pertusum TaxID=174260 RepID=A0A9X0D003_9CNID|nr:hypothetical protein OS493_012530 [Desmophyllum pertusum]
MKKGRHKTKPFTQAQYRGIPGRTEKNHVRFPRKPADFSHVVKERLGQASKQSRVSWYITGDKKVTLSDAGQYICNASNAFSSDTTYVNVSVYGK